MPRTPSNRPKGFLRLNGSTQVAGALDLASPPLIRSVALGTGTLPALFAAGVYISPLRANAHRIMKGNSRRHTRRRDPRAARSSLLLHVQRAMQRRTAPRCQGRKVLRTGHRVGGGRLSKFTHVRARRKPNPNCRAAGTGDCSKTPKAAFSSVRVGDDPATAPV